MTQTDDFAKAIYSLSIVAIFANFQNPLISRLSAVFFAPFSLYNSCNVIVESFSACFNLFYFLTQANDFCKGYSLCMVAIFTNFQNSFISRILAVFSKSSWRRTNVM